MLFRCPPGAQVREPIEGTCAPEELLLAQPHMDGELEAVRVGTYAADGNGDLIGADQEQLGRSHAGDHGVWPQPGRIPGPLERGRWPLRDGFKKAHVLRLFLAVCCARRAGAGCRERRWTTM